MKNYKCENCKRYVIRSNYYTFYLHYMSHSEETKRLNLCFPCFKLCGKYYYDDEKAQKTCGEEIRIPYYLPYDQHKKYLLIKMKQDKLSNDSKL